MIEEIMLNFMSGIKGIEVMDLADCGLCVKYNYIGSVSIS